MSLEVIALADFLENEEYSESVVQNILDTFKSIRFHWKSRGTRCRRFLKKKCYII
jgi:hypothetical protein